MRRNSNEGLQADVLAFLLVKCQGKGSRVTRKHLVEAMRARGHLKDLSDDVADRQVRQALADLRRGHKLGALICGTSSASGYWIARSAPELEQVVVEQEHRGRSILEGASRQRRNGLEALRALPLEQGELL